MVYLRATSVVALVLALVSRATSFASCPCTCWDDDVTPVGSYAFVDVYLVTNSEDATGMPTPDNWYGTASYSGGVAEAFASAIASSGGYGGSDSGHCIATAGGSRTEVWRWSGSPSEATGALYTAGMSGNGRAFVYAHVSASAWFDDADASASADSQCSGTVVGQGCSGSTPFSSVSAGVEGVRVSADIDGSLSLEGGLGIGESAGNLGGTASHSGNHTANWPRTWVYAASAELCVGEGATEVSAYSLMSVSGIADAYAYGSVFTLAESNSYADMKSELTATIGNMRRCDN